MSQRGTGINQCLCSKCHASESEVSLCLQHAIDYFWRLCHSSGVSISIVGVIIVLHTLNLLLIKFMGYGTESEQTLGIQLSFYLAMFFNASNLVMLLNANTTDNLL